VSAGAVQHLAKYIFVIEAHERDISPDYQANSWLARDVIVILNPKLKSQ